MSQQPRLPHGEIPVLLVEDDRHTANALKQLLAAIDARITVDWVTSAESATRLISRRGYFVVLCDHNLAGRAKGLEMWHLFAKNVEDYSRFILMSAHSREAIIAELGTPEHFPEFLQKPFGRQELERVIREAIGP